MAAVKIVVKFFLQTQKLGKVPHLIFLHLIVSDLPMLVALLLLVASET